MDKKGMRAFDVTVLEPDIHLVEVKNVVIHRDRRQKKRQQEELAKAYELLNSVFDTTHMMVAYMDCDFNFIQVNRAYAQANGRAVQYFFWEELFRCLRFK